MIDQAAEGGADVVDVLEDLLEGVVEPEVPNLGEMPEQSGAEVDAWVFLVAVRRTRGGYVCVGGAEVRFGESGGAVDNQAAFAFA